MRRSVVTRHCLSKKLDAETGVCRVVGVLLVSKTVLHCEMGLYVDSFLPEAEKTPILTPVLFRFALHRGRVRVLQEELLSRNCFVAVLALMRASASVSPKP